ncbi:hypothetical protein PPERSA_09313 [Pseudocohnilembus persalinus]|uniref:RRM domain-containing protein n=1 Tax=Pseudocohnilembus persalinus TaxID=266149 RepID=A0A0V0R585_PSEPJ|nr:hypothetical protein PPERSA_09313 [Pseudocohnilembus persalinus]|eukprot:KRX09643.1 hypothetical protein PPERSA_09313 [Pseudocohnilembus persalinus]
MNGLSPKLAQEKILRKLEYMGQYGQIKKIIVNPRRGNEEIGVYVSYEYPVEASLAILSVDAYFDDDNHIRAFYGSTKYCNSFLRKLDCFKKDCPYLHDWDEKFEFHKDKKFFIDYREIAISIISEQIKLNQYLKIIL